MEWSNDIQPNSFTTEHLIQPYFRYALPALDGCAVLINLLALILLCCKGPIQQYQVTVYLIALATSNILYHSFLDLPSNVLRLLSVNSGFKGGVCILTVFLSDVGAGCFLPVLLCLLVDRWLTAMRSRYPATCLTRIANKICCLFTARLLTCICFTVAILVNVYTLFSESDFRDQFCYVDAHSSLVHIWVRIQYTLTYYLPLVLIPIACLAFFALCCACNRPAHQSIADDGMKEDLLTWNDQKILIVLLVGSSLLYVLWDVMFSQVKGLEFTRTFKCLIPSLFLPFVTAYRQHIANLCKRDRKKEGEEAQGNGKKDGEEKEETQGMMEIKEP